MCGVKGMRRSSEHNQKIADALRGRKKSSEHVLKVIESRSKNEHWLNAVKNPSHGWKISEALKGRSHSKVHTLKSAESLMKNDSWRKGLLERSVGNTYAAGRVWKEESIRKLSASHSTPEMREIHRKNASLLKRDVVFRKKISDAHSTPEMKEFHRRIALSIPRKMTSIERRVANDLVGIKKTFFTQYCLGGRFLYDFYIPADGLLIECDGEYWHSSEKMRLRDAEKDLCADQFGLRLVRIPGSKIMSASFEIGEFI